MRPAVQAGRIFDRFFTLLLTCFGRINIGHFTDATNRQRSYNSELDFTVSLGLNLSVCLYRSFAVEKGRQTESDAIGKVGQEISETLDEFGRIDERASAVPHLTVDR